MAESWEAQFTRILIPLYGLQKAQQITTVITPNFISDFKGMLKKAALGEEITEEYESDDHRFEVHLKGVKKFKMTGVELQVTGMEVLHNGLTEKVALPVQADGSEVLVLLDA